MPESSSAASSLSAVERCCRRFEAIKADHRQIGNGSVAGQALGVDPIEDGVDRDVKS
jgi:hypothetical protein